MARASIRQRGGDAVCQEAPGSGCQSSKAPNREPMGLRLGAFSPRRSGPPRVARYGCVAGVCLPEPVQLPVSTAVSGWAKVWVASAFPPLSEFLK